MNQTSHTAGPWKAERSSPTHITSEKSIIATTFHGLKPVAEAEANARLIAAAPDLLDACRNILFAWECGGDAGRDLIAPIDDARRAIAKAMGE